MKKVGLVFYRNMVFIMTVVGCPKWLKILLFAERAPPLTTCLRVSTCKGDNFILAVSPGWSSDFGGMQMLENRSEIADPNLGICTF